jgi:hypothetical protein
MLEADLDDSDRLAARALHGLSRAQDRVADALATLADRAPLGGLETVMRTPVRGAVLTAIFSQMPRRVDRSRAVGVEATVRWRIRHEGSELHDVYDLVFSCGRIAVERPRLPAQVARVTITLGATELLQLASGSLDPMEAYFGGRLELSGDILFAAKLATMFSAPARRR